MDSRFYGRWIAANTGAEAAGLGTTFLLGRLVAPHLDAAPGVLTVVIGAALAVVLGMLLEGVVVGAAQEWVLRPALPTLQPGRWIRATAIGAGIAWLVGMIPSTVLTLRSPAFDAAPPTEPAPLIQYGLGVGMGLVTGPILGVAQWTVLRRMVPAAHRWLWANALAWGVGLPVIFVGMDRVAWTGPAATMALGIYATCAVAGTVVGAIHGLVLRALVRGAFDQAQRPQGSRPSPW